MYPRTGCVVAVLTRRRSKCKRNNENRRVTSVLTRQQSKCKRNSENRCVTSVLTRRQSKCRRNDENWRTRKEQATVKLLYAKRLICYDCPQSSDVLRHVGAILYVAAFVCLTAPTTFRLNYITAGYQN
jgi:hypothetical protein